MICTLKNHIKALLEAEERKPAEPSRKKLFWTITSVSPNCNIFLHVLSAANEEGAGLGDEVYLALCLRLLAKKY